MIDFFNVVTTICTDWPKVIHMELTLVYMMKCCIESPDLSYNSPFFRQVNINMWMNI